MLFTINASQISHNAFDDETIVIHFASGNYFSLRDAASAIWKRLEKQPLTASAIAAAFDEAPAEAVTEVDHFLGQLLKNQLICETQDGGEPESVDGLGCWRAPKIEIYDDMRNTLLGDVIHDTDESGWPQMAPDGLRQ
ncbi:hypothetical protein K227x_57250 [Rubripirellula lacrimiformis]|uniref:PqqD family protein n=1 Tax=Rubripirellula lacrimiformis TaxID=1930273 RepID=A0A517NJI9_9BACT|nr:PqqD family protein [Rubripirellula lacrimiformis]QDT07298.1 hypothetical protein K227x_57250 [Rubripirellula lacrimiformis]